MVLLAISIILAATGAVIVCESEDKDYIVFGTMDAVIGAIGVISALAELLRNL